ncbi:MAG: cation diffusion facilitator family transporter [Desulfovibrionaceae bacterium]|nr:cation diffusion facilitator family transporter [Desulfovibrionaceae bacterium]MBF0514437.1 cation diffusion facilitator family transporter [Desulfovibrionaceae bacterium]
MHLDGGEGPRSSPLEGAQGEKRWAALASVVAALALTAMKIVVGLATNSLGILSEAAHSALDLVAAAVTYFAVRISDLPPDKRHPYGHGKVENLAALAETSLLLGTCLWILYEAGNRLFFHPEDVEISIWSFLVIAVSIAVDIGRSRMLSRAAKKHHSQALEADALHFSTDVWSSAVVGIGLAAVWAAGAAAPGSPWRGYLIKADAAAAVIVGALVISVSIRLGRRAVDALLDGSQTDQSEAIERAVSRVPGVAKVSHLRLRQSGPAAFVDMTLVVREDLSLEEAHAISDAAEQAVLDQLAHADIVVHIEPMPMADGQSGLVDAVRALAARLGLSVHAVMAHQLRDEIHLDAHLEVPGRLTLQQAHAAATEFEQAAQRELPGVASVATHIEPAGEGQAKRQNRRINAKAIRELVLALPQSVPEIHDCHKIVMRENARGPSVSFHCRMDGQTPIATAHEMTANLERLLRSRAPALWRVTIHIEPGRAEAE